MRILTQTLEQGTSDLPEREIFEEQFRQMWSAHTRRIHYERKITTVAGLELVSGARDFKLPEGLSVRRLPDLGTWQRVWLAGQFSEYEDLNHDPDTHCALVAENRYQFDDLGNRWPQNRHLDANILTLTHAILIHCPGILYVMRRFVMDPGRFPLKRGLSYSDRIHPSGLGWYERPCLLSPPDVTRVRRLQRLLLRYSVEGSPLQAGISRFVASYSEDSSWLQQVVDLTIALEALVGPEDSQGEITHRLRTRLAFLIGGSGLAQSSRVFQLAGTMYDIRSRVLHGATITQREREKWLRKILERSPERDDLKHFVEAVHMCRQLVRRAVVGVLGLLEASNSDTSYPLPKQFDELMAEPSARRLWGRVFRQRLQEDHSYFKNLRSYDDRRRERARAVDG